MGSIIETGQFICFAPFGLLVISSLSLSPPLSLCLSFFGRRWLSLACSSPSPLLAAPFSPFLTLSIPLRSCSAPLPSLIPTFVCLFCSLPIIPSLYHFPGAHIKEQEKEQASLSSTAISYLLSLAPLPAFPPAPRSTLRSLLLRYTSYSRRNSARPSINRSLFIFSCPALANIQSLVRRASLKVPGLAFRSQSYPELRR